MAKRPQRSVWIFLVVVALTGLALAIPILLSYYVVSPESWQNSPTPPQGCRYEDFMPGKGADIRLVCSTP